MHVSNHEENQHTAVIAATGKTIETFCRTLAEQAEKMLRIGFKPEDQNKNRSQNFEINTEIRINMLNSWKPYHKNQTKLLFQILKTQKSFFFKLIP